MVKRAIARHKIERGAEYNEDDLLQRLKIVDFLKAHLGLEVLFYNPLPSKDEHHASGTV
jgi:hypothetical protein